MIAERSQTSKQGDSNAGNFSHRSPLSSSFCGIQSQKSRGVLMRWIGQDIPPSTSPIPRLT